jgi:hypothetical protein
LINICPETRLARLLLQRSMDRILGMLSANASGFCCVATF